MNKADIKRHMAEGETVFAVCGTDQYSIWNAVKAEVVELDVEKDVWGKNKKAIKIKIVEDSKRGSGAVDVWRYALGWKPGVGSNNILKAGDEFFVEGRYVHLPWSDYEPLLEKHLEQERERKEAQEANEERAKRVVARLAKLGLSEDQDHFVESYHHHNFTFSSAQLERLLDRVLESVTNEVSR